jgi:hypothetical protein
VARAHRPRARGVRRGVTANGGTSEGEGREHGEAVDRWPARRYRDRYAPSVADRDLDPGPRGRLSDL